VSGDRFTVRGGAPLRGRLRLPGCKGIAHRALIAAAMAAGDSRIGNLPDGEDVASTASVLRGLGVSIERDGDRAVTVAGGGVERLIEPETVLDCGNSGTTMRMVAGLLAGRPGLAVLTGDASLSRRPMARVLEPLRALGARVDGRAGGTRAPITVRGGDLQGSALDLAVPSGQVKTALLLAGLQASGTTEVREPAPSRDHTERLMGALGAPIEVVDPTTVRARAGAPRAFELDVPGDPSSAAFFAVAAAIVPGSDVVIEDVGVNPRRVAYLDVLRAMGAEVEVAAKEDRLGEPVGDVRVRAAALRGVDIAGSEGIIDELPVLAVAAAFASGTTTITGAAELAVKESDRIATLAELLRALGVEVETRADGLDVHGGTPRGGAVASQGDHRIAMAGAVAGLAAAGETTVTGWEAVRVSYPGFATDLASLQEEKS
jgi:3-phosphoshikimate 1-carboxyvinyltransferase